MLFLAGGEVQVAEQVLLHRKSHTGLNSLVTKDKPILPTQETLCEYLFWHSPMEPQKKNFLQQQHRDIIIGIINIFLIIINLKQTKIFDQMTIETQTEAPPVAVFSGGKTNIIL